MNVDQNASFHRLPRIPVIDVARGVALVAMAIYHFTWDLGFFGYVAPDLAITGGWRLFARLIATSFLFLVGVSLVLAHSNGIRWQGFWKRLALVAGAALLISVATWWLTPETFIFFGILHHIALASVVGLAFLRLPAFLVALLAAVFAILPLYVSSALFDPRYLAWTGLAQQAPRSNDLVPLFPFFAAVLAGIAATRLAVSFNLAERLSRIGVARIARPLEIGGRHSLLVYLVHQPILIAAIWLFSLVVPAPAPELEAARVPARSSRAHSSARPIAAACCRAFRPMKPCLRNCSDRTILPHRKEWLALPISAVSRPKD